MTLIFVALVLYYIIELWLRANKIPTGSHAVGFVLFFSAKTLVFMTTTSYEKAKALHSMRTIEVKKEKPYTQNVLEMMEIFSKRRLEFFIGYDKRKNPIKLNLEKDHVLIVASTGGGKTTLLQNIMIQFFASPVYAKKIRVHLFDLKGDKDDHLHRWEPLCDYYRIPQKDGNFGQVIQDLKRVFAEIRDDESGIKHYVVIDELAMFTMMPESSAERRQAINIISAMASILRSKGKIIAATQNATAEVIPRQVSVNILNRIMFRVMDKTQADVAMGYSYKGFMPTETGQFVLNQKGKTINGNSFLYNVAQIDQVLSRNIGATDDPRVQSMMAQISGVKINDKIMGQTAYFNTYEGAKPTIQDIREERKEWEKLGIVEIKKGGTLLRVTPHEAIIRMNNARKNSA